ncbi:MAG: DUF1349 domain-containing protein [Polyangiales bacterium]
MLISVPAGTAHHAWNSNTAIRVMQASADEDFELKVKFESEPTQQYQSQGLPVEESEGNYIRFDVYSDGGSFNVFGATFTNGKAAIPIATSVGPGATTYLRLGRAGNQWTASYSCDGSTWTTAGTFSHSLTVSSVGVLGGNFDPSPAYTAAIDYFVETSFPIDPEDPPLCDPRTS